MLLKFSHRHFSHIQGCIFLILGVLSCLFAIVSFVSILKFPTSLEDMAVIGDRGINLYLTLFTYMSIIIGYTFASPTLRIIFFAIQIFIFSGAIGSLFPSSHPTVARLVRWGRPQAEIQLGSLTIKEKCNISEADHSCLRPDVGRVVLTNDNFKAMIRFNVWPEDFKQWLEKTAKGEVVCIIWPIVFKNLSFPINISVQKPLSSSLPPLPYYHRTFSGQRFWLDPVAAQILLATRKLTIQPALAGAREETFLAFRDYHTSAQSREDVYIYNGKTYSLPYDGIFPIVFMFESPTGMPLALFL